MTSSFRFALPALLLLAMSAPPAGAQVPVEFPAGSSVVSRADLQNLLRQYEEAAQSPAYSDRIRTSAQAAADRIRRRLEEGDFQVGDRVVLAVQGEPNLPDTVPVQTGPQISLPLFGSISLEGVLRSEITEHLTRELGEVIRDPVVRAQALMRLSVQGSVGSPGFYVVPSDMLLSEALMVAGGPAPDAALERLRVERGNRQLLAESEVQAALLEGRTLDQLSLQAGDQIVLPEEETGQGLLWTVGRYALAIGSAVFLGIRIF